VALVADLLVVCLVFGTSSFQWTSWALLACTLLVGFRWWRTERHRRRLAYVTCSRCTARNWDWGGAETLRCTSESDCGLCHEVCDGETSHRLQLLDNLRFGTLGIAATGQTFWLSILLRELRLGRYPQSIHVAPAHGPGVNELDRNISSILAGHGTGATHSQVNPDPGVFHVVESVGCCPSAVQLNLIDKVAGMFAVRDHPHRPFAFEMDGLFLFPDLTAPESEQQKAI
jgi:hypothetical protein